MSGGNFNKLGHLEKNIKNGRVDSSETDFNILFWLVWLILIFCGQTTWMI